MTDATTFKQRLLPLHGKLYLVALRILGDSDDARDVVQDLYVRLWEQRRSLNNVESLDGYVVKMTRNMCFDMMRNRKVHEPLAAVDGTASYSPVHDLEMHDRFEHVIRIIDDLPVSQREAVRLRDLEGKEMDEIENRLHVSPENARKLLSRARTAIKKHFETH